MTITDNRILNVLFLGEQIKNCLDPENILDNASVKSFYHSSCVNDTFSWIIRFVFVNGDILELRGAFTLSNGFLINYGKLLSLNKGVRISIKPSKTVLGALGDLSLLNPRLKINLSSNAIKKPVFVNADNVFSIDKLSLGCNALFWNIEGGNKSEIRSLFNTICYDYSFSNEGVPVSVNIKGEYHSNKDCISVFLTMDYYGLSKKEVLLNKTFGNNSISCKCFTYKDNKKYPSIILALELLKDIGNDNKSPKQRRTKLTMGKPRFKSK